MPWQWPPRLNLAQFPQNKPSCHLLNRHLAKGREEIGGKLLAHGFNIAGAPSVHLALEPFLRNLPEGHSALRLAAAARILPGCNHGFQLIPFVSGLPERHRRVFPYHQPGVHLLALEPIFPGFQPSLVNIQVKPSSIERIIRFSALLAALIFFSVNAMCVPLLRFLLDTHS